MKKLFTLFFALTFICQAFAFNVEGIYYNITSSTNLTVEVTSSSGSYSGLVSIPESVIYSGKTYSVTSIGSSAFYKCSGLTSITIPESVTSIGSSAFSECSGLTSITIPESVTSIGDYAFYGCSGLTSITIPESVTSIGSLAFFGCSSLPVIDNLRYADTYLIEAVDTTQTSYSIKAGTSQIMDFAFSNCANLTSITIPSSVTRISHYAFYSCISRTNITVEGGNSTYDSRNGCNAIIETATNTLILGCKNTVIPSSVTCIGDYAFARCRVLTSINIPESVTSIGSEAFTGCSGLTNITIPSSVTSIGYGAFFWCTGKLSVDCNIGDKSTEYGWFYGSDFSSVVIGNNVTSIGNYAFRQCDKLTSVTIPNSVTSIGRYAFYGCTGKLSVDCNIGNANQSDGWFNGSCFSSVEIGKNVTSIGDYAFYGCGELTSITIPSSVTSIGWGAFAGCKLRDILILAETPPSIKKDTFSGQSQYHTTLLVPVGCWDKYAYDDTYWYTFINIKENANTTKDLSKIQAYTLKNVADRSYLVYDPVNDAVATVDLDANICESDPNQNWQFIELDGKFYIYNLGAKKYLAENTSDNAAPMRGMAVGVNTAWSLSDAPVAISLQDDSNGVNLGSSGAWLFVLNESLQVDQNVSVIETISTIAADAPIFDLQGRRINDSAKGQLLIQRGKKAIIK